MGPFVAIVFVYFANSLNPFNSTLVTILQCSTHKGFAMLRLKWKLEISFVCVEFYFENLNCGLWLKLKYKCIDQHSRESEIQQDTSHQVPHHRVRQTVECWQVTEHYSQTSWHIWTNVWSNRFKFKKLESSAMSRV